MHDYYDIIIIGSGIAGLYSAYLIKEMCPHLSLIILERDKRNWIGGRIGNDQFYGETVVIGAGVGRKKKDTLLMKLLKDLHIKTTDCDIRMNYAKTIPKVVNVEEIIGYLQKEYKQNPPKYNSQTFSQFAKSKLGSELYKAFTICAGYTDYENEDVYETLFHYGMNDNTPGWKSVLVPWKELVQKLVAKIEPNQVKPKTNVLQIQQIQQTPSIFQINTSNKTYVCNKVIVATNITSILKLIPNANAKNSPYLQIHGQPFLRVYGKFTKKTAEMLSVAVPYQTIVPGPLHKLIPLDNGVFMIAYTDNAGALFLKDHLENTPENCRFFEHLLEQSLGIPKDTLKLIAIKGYYWPIGTHYYSPLKGFSSRELFLKTVQHPMPNMLVVGEAVSRIQGWTEGALESVTAVLSKKWLQCST